MTNPPRFRHKAEDSGKKSEGFIDIFQLLGMVLAGRERRENFW
jgi:hypothetical protein